MARILGFPNPVNETSARIVATGAVLMSLLFLVSGNGWVLLPLTYGFVARVLTGPTLSPLGRLATQVITPRINREHMFVAGPPKRFAQGIGATFTVTASERNVVRELAGRSAIERLQEVVEALPTREYELLRSGIHVGIVVDEHKADFDRGDFLVRNVLGADADRGLTVGEFVDVGQTVQFHVRDAESAHDDLHAVVRHSVRGRRSALAALMFTCNGRGSNLFGRPNHDAALVHELADDDLCLTGMSCAGELGPVGGRTFLHGFTASLALFGDSLVLVDA